MRRVTQSRTGEDGTCFRSCVASLLNLKESQVPDWPDANQDAGVNRWLAGRGLRYDEVPVQAASAPVGLHIITGLSPRGGAHAVVGRDGCVVMDPHPQDGTGRGLVEKYAWGLLTPLNKAEDADPFTRVYKNKKTATGKAVTNYHLGKKCASCGGPIDNHAKPGARCQGCLADQYNAAHGRPSTEEGDRIRAAIRRTAEKELAKDSYPKYWTEAEIHRLADPGKNGVKAAARIRRDLAEQSYFYWEREVKAAEELGFEDDADKARTQRNVYAKMLGCVKDSLRLIPDGDGELNFVYTAKDAYIDPSDGSVHPGPKPARQFKAWAKDAKLDRYPMADILATLGITIAEYMRRTEPQKERLLQTAVEKLGKVKAKDAVLDGATGRDAIYPKTNRQYPTTCKLCGQKTRVLTGLSGPDVYDWHNTPAGKSCKAGGKRPDKVAVRDADYGLSNVCLNCKGTSRAMYAGQSRPCAQCGGTGKSKNTYKTYGSATKIVKDRSCRARDYSIANTDAYTKMRAELWLHQHPGSTMEKAIEEVTKPYVKPVDPHTAKVVPIRDRSRYHAALDAVMDAAQFREAYKGFNLQLEPLASLKGKVVWTARLDGKLRGWRERLPELKTAIAAGDVK